MSISPDLTGGFIIKVWGQIVLLGTTTFEKCRKKDFYTTKDMTMGIGDSYYGDSYYRLGDVVKDEDGALWFCVQPSGVPEMLRNDYLEHDAEWGLSPYSE